MGVVSKIARQLTKKVVKKDTPTIQKDVDPLKVARETLPAARDVDIKNLDATTKKFLGKVASIDKPMSTTYKNIFSNETNDAIETVSEILYSDTFGGTTPYGFYKNISQSRLNKVKKNIYNLTQKKLKSYPDELVVYRSGNLDPFKMKEKGVDPSQEPLSFSLNPDYDAELNLPWYERMGSQSLQAYKVKKKDILASTDLRREMREDEIIIRPKDVKAIENKNMNKGGVTMKKQMEMFNEGGLEQDGGSVDPVSGNEVPIGSSKEEVRDDIDAKLSEGEFVFPADVVRFIGLNNLMQIRQEAKAGLKKMEAMGQMGNSEEATMPDDIPFSSEDIMVEDDDGNEGDLEMNVGGFVPNQGVYYQPSQVGSQFNIAPQIPAYKPPQPFQLPMQQQQQQTGYGPSFMGQPQTQQQYTGFQDLLPNAQAYESVEYINNTTGETMIIPHVDGKPIYPPPAGFVIKPKDEVKPEEPKTEEVTTPTTQVTQDDDDDRNENENRLKSTKSLLGVTSTLGVGEGLKGLASNKFAQAGLALLTGGITPAILALTGIPQKIADTIIGKVKSGEELTEEEQLQADALSSRMSQLKSKTGRATGQSTEAKNLSNRLGGMYVSGRVGLEVGDIDPVTGGIFNQAGQAVDPVTNENLTSYRSFKDAKVSMKAGAKAGWFGGEVSKNTYMGLGEEGKKRYGNYVQNMKEEGVSIASEGRQGSGTIDPTAIVTTKDGTIVTKDEGKDKFGDDKPRTVVKKQDLVNSIANEYGDPRPDDNEGGGNRTDGKVFTSKFEPKSGGGSGASPEAPNRGTPFLSSKGGIASKPKKKKMKRGGLASKK